MGSAWLALVVVGAGVFVVRVVQRLRDRRRSASGQLGDLLTAAVDQNSERMGVYGRMSNQDQGGPHSGQNRTSGR